MVKEVVWTFRASNTYLEIIEYLLKEFGTSVVEDFATTVHEKIELIISNPFLFRKSQAQKNIFITVIHKRVILSYRYRPVLKKVELLVFWDTRRNPSKFPYR
ncbi:MAG: type II toxin-antitoxin system RelE/ParE family toxin [Chitinophagaceae bacterium]